MKNDLLHMMNFVLHGLRKKGWLPVNLGVFVSFWKTVLLLCYVLRFAKEKEIENPQKKQKDRALPIKPKTMFQNGLRWWCLLLRGWALENKKKHVGISQNYISMHAYPKK